MQDERTVMTNILICDDEKDIVSALKIYLDNPEYHIFESYNGEQAVEIIRTEEIHLVLLDIMMPVMDGFSTLMKIREMSNVPVIFLTAKSEDNDKIMGLTVGADDYITKPFNPIEVIARVKSQLRRYMQLGSNTAKPESLVYGGIELNDRAKSVLVDGEQANLTPKEYEILKLMMENRGRVISPKEIYEKVWGVSAVANDANTVAVHIRHLREKTEIDPTNPRYIKVVFGQGYIFG